jgi:hypothetical protein
MNSTIFGATILITVFFRCWLTALRDSVTECTSSTCDVWGGVGKHMAHALLASWTWLIAIVFIMWSVEVIVVGMIRAGPPDHATTNPWWVSPGLRVFLSWMNWRILAAMTLSFVTAFLFATLVITVTRWHIDDAKLPRAEREKAI